MNKPTNSKAGGVGGTSGQGELWDEGRIARCGGSSKDSGETLGKRAMWQNVD